MTPRERLHHKVRHHFAGTIANYYRSFPEELKDPRLEEQMKSMLKLMEGILAEIDEFDIVEKEESDPGPAKQN